jgi:FtsP/CotA-like multicopper oxidase with cupredoxin domain
MTDTSQHGHDFYILGAGLGLWNNSMASSLQYTNPPRRDVAMFHAAPGPANDTPDPGGWLVLAFLTDNPGAWLMHCHIVSSPAVS